MRAHYVIAKGFSEYMQMRNHMNVNKIIIKLNINLKNPLPQMKIYIRMITLLCHQSPKIVSQDRSLKEMNQANWETNSKILACFRIASTEQIIGTTAPALRASAVARVRKAAEPSMQSLE